MNNQPGRIKRLVCWIQGCGSHKVDVVSSSLGGRSICMRCGKDFDYSIDKVIRP